VSAVAIASVRRGNVPAGVIISRGRITSYFFGEEIKKNQNGQVQKFSDPTSAQDRPVVVIPAPAGSAAANNSKKNNVTPEELGIMGLATATVAQSKPNEPCVPKEWDLNSPLSLPTDTYISPGTPNDAQPGDPRYYNNGSCLAERALAEVG
jgi:hypothetical protein